MLRGRTKPSPTMTEYEKRRQANIAGNTRKLVSLGLLTYIKPKPPAAKRPSLKSCLSDDESEAEQSGGDWRPR